MSEICHLLYQILRGHKNPFLISGSPESLKLAKPKKVKGENVRLLKKVCGDVGIFLVISTGTNDSHL